MITKEDINNGKLSIGLFFVITLIASPFTSWWVLYGYVIFISIILFMLTVDNIRDKIEKPLDRSFGQIGKFNRRTSESGVLDVIFYLFNFFKH